MCSSFVKRIFIFSQICVFFRILLCLYYPTLLCIPILFKTQHLRFRWWIKECVKMMKLATWRVLLVLIMMYLMYYSDKMTWGRRFTWIITCSVLVWPVIWTMQIFLIKFFKCFYKWHSNWSGVQTGGFSGGLEDYVTIVTKPPIILLELFRYLDMQLANFTTPSHVTRDWASGTSKPVFYCYRFHISKLMCKIILLFSFTFRFHVAVTSYSPLNHKTKLALFLS